MKEQINKILDRAKSAVKVLKQHLAFILIVAFLLVYIGVILEIKQLSDAQPTPAQLSSNLKASSQPQVDPQALSKIQQLQNNNIQVQSLFEQARNNPFSE